MLSTVTAPVLNYYHLVSTHVFGYYKLDKRNHILDAVDVYMDPIVRTKHGIWVDVPRKALDELAALDIDVNASVHAAGNVYFMLKGKCIIYSFGFL
jgi:DEAD/DEAH box helicase domain-containing protein